MHELDTVYGIEDAYDIAEVIAVDAINRQIIHEQDKENQS